MANNLKLITTENFGDLSCNFYRNLNDDIFLTREQIGTALEYACPDDALSKIHKRHFDRLNPLSVVARLASTDGKEYETILYTQRGIMEICRWSNKPKANIFMDWVWDIVEKYRNNELNTQDKLSTAIDNMNNILSAMNDRLTKLEESQSKEQSQPAIETTYKKPYNPWFAKMQPKYKTFRGIF